MNVNISVKGVLLHEPLGQDVCLVDLCESNHLIILVSGNV
jgi:hypothetical protein